MGRGPTLEWDLDSLAMMSFWSHSRFRGGLFEGDISVGRRRVGAGEMDWFRVVEDRER